MLAMITCLSFHTEDDSRDVQAGPVSHLPDQDEALAEYKGVYVYVCVCIPCTCV